MEATGEPNTANFLNQYNSKLYFKHVSLYSQMSLALTPHQTYFFFATDRDHLRNLQLVKIQAAIDWEIPSPT